VRERYVRPPLAVRDSARPRAGVWRFRVVFTLLVIALAVGLFFAIRAVVGSGGGEGRPDIQQLQAPPPLRG
jgi:hypothetical protein